MRLIAAPFSMEVDRRVPRIVRRFLSTVVLGSETLQASPRLDQRTVHCEVLVADQLSLPGFGQHLIEKPARHLAINEPLAVLTERGRIPNRLIHA